MNSSYLTRATFIASNLSTIKAGVTNTVILGGNAITANTSNTAYVEQLGFWQVGTTEGFLQKANITASRNWTLPDETGIVMVGPAFNALIATPTITEDGKVIAWNDASQEYELIAIPVLPANIVETVTTTDGSFIDLTPNAPVDGAVTITADLSATGTADTTTFLGGDNVWNIALKSLTVGNSTFINLQNVGTVNVPDITATLSATGTADATTFLRGDNTWATPAGGGGGDGIYDGSGSLSSATEVSQAGFDLGFTGGDVGFGTATPTAGAAVEIDSSTQGLLLPRWNNVQQASNTSSWTNTQRGMMWFNTDTNQFMGWNGTASVILG
jgi:hypothetical protein